MEVSAEEFDGRLVLSHALTDDARLVAPLAAYAAGRMLRESAVLAYGDGKAFLWQEAPADAGTVELTRLFESFMDSCDWWGARVDALREGGEAQPSHASEAMVILP